MAYYEIDLLARCTVIVEADNEEQAISEAEWSATKGDFEVMDYRTEELDEKTLDSAKRHCDIDLTK
ncbi:hypothetical protein [Entomomonas asaccharolytica]|uniref:Uncharacterized protein n=1 Tax=Entomomonas asaccharolytica TaxID=2785331 RepID=A0A974NI03_9GAMM|nr:hypothetical protein [Entomomonas asaccharolytica]QQP86907.1 hypothetical protein JHT90_06595 [Entomomonas asaccharolytica]